MIPSGNEHEYSLSTRMSTLSTVFQPGTARPHLLRLPSAFRWLAASDLKLEIRLVESPARLPVIVLCWYAITNQHQIGGTRYVFEGMCHELLYLYI